MTGPLPIAAWAWSRRPRSSNGKRAQLERALVAAKDRGWSVWIFTPAAGMGPGGPGHLLADEKSQAAFAARTLDTLAHYPMADGGIMDGPEWGYEIAPHHMNHRSDLFNDLPESIAPKCAALGYDYRALVAAKERLFARLHARRTRWRCTPPAVCWAPSSSSAPTRI